MRYLERLFKRTSPEELEIEGYPFIVYPEVMRPTTGDSSLLRAGVKGLARSFPEVLDMGCGCGVNGILTCLWNKADSCIGVDINPHAVENAWENARKLSIPFTGIVSNMFLEVPVGQYGLILANGPHHEGNRVAHPLYWAVYGAEDFVDTLLSRVGEYMDFSSLVLIVIAVLKGQEDNFSQKAKNCGLQAERKAFFPQKKSTYVLYECSKRR